MRENFNTYIEGIDPDFWKKICINEGELRHYEKGEEFVSAGKVAKYLAFIEKGSMKYVACSEDGVSHVLGLEFAGEFVADFPFSLRGMKARISIVAVTDCDLYCITSARVAELMEHDAELRNRVMLATEAVFSTVYDRYLALYTLSPAARYKDLISRHPDLFEIFPLKDIASFLNITPTHLSRLRRMK